jgi:hypothetical protein
MKTLCKLPRSFCKLDHFRALEKIVNIGETVQLTRTVSKFTPESFKSWASEPVIKYF